MASAGGVFRVARHVGAIVVCATSQDAYEDNIVDNGCLSLWVQLVLTSGHLQRSSMLYLLRPGHDRRFHFRYCLSFAGI
jgi:hypothetical protein